IQNTYKESKDNPDYTTFLKHFGEYNVQTLERTNISSEKYIIDSLNEIKERIKTINPKPKYTNQTLLKFFDAKEIDSRIIDTILNRFCKEKDLKDIWEVKSAGYKKELTEYIMNSEEIKLTNNTKNDVIDMVEYLTEDLPF